MVRLYSSQREENSKSVCGTQKSFFFFVPYRLLGGERKQGRDETRGEQCQAPGVNPVDRCLNQDTRFRRASTAQAMKLRERDSLSLGKADIQLRITTPRFNRLIMYPPRGQQPKKCGTKKLLFFFVLQEGKENRGETRREVSSARRLRGEWEGGGAPPRSDGTYEAGRSPGHREAEGKPLRSPNNIKLFTLCIRAASR